MNLKERGWESVKWNHLAEAVDKWQALASSVKEFNVLNDAGCFLNGWENIALSVVRSVHIDNQFKTLN